MIEVKESILIYAARYAHHRNTGAAFSVVINILREWDNLPDNDKRQIYKESFEAEYDDCAWRMVQRKYELENGKESKEAFR